MSSANNRQLLTYLPSGRDILVEGAIVAMENLNVPLSNDLLYSSTNLFGEQQQKLVWMCHRADILQDTDLRYLHDFDKIVGLICCHQRPQHIKRMS